MAGKAKALETRKVEGHDNVQIGVYNLVNPVNLHKFQAEYAEATDFGGIAEAAKQNGLTLAQVNEAMRGIRRETFIEALGKTADDRITGFIKAAKDMGMEDDDINAQVESLKAKLGNKLPSGLTQLFSDEAKTVPVIAKRKGRAPGSKVTNGKAAA